MNLPAKILITGGTGFLGSYIIKQLVEKNYAVRAIRRGNKLPTWISKEITDKVEWVEGDILDVVALQDAMESDDRRKRPAYGICFHQKDHWRCAPGHRIIPYADRPGEP